MSSSIFKNKLCLAIAATTLSVCASADSMSYSAVQINSQHSVLDGVTNDTASSAGSTVSIADSGNQTYAFWNGSSGYRFIPVADSVSATASLQTGELKTYASLSLGVGSKATMPIGQNNGSASATASFADSFNAFSGSSPYIWDDNSTAHFSFGITGTTTIPNNITAPSSYDPGQPKNTMFTQLTFLAYKPGGLSLSNQMKKFDWNSYADYDVAYNDFMTLADQLSALSITSDSWLLGDAMTLASFDSSHRVAVNANTPALINVDFNPGGDFEWQLVLDSLVQLDTSQQNVSATMDFSHTITANYIGPDGTTTYSASGLFPNTVSMSSVPAAVPVPAAAWLFGSGILGLAGVARKRKIAP